MRFDLYIHFVNPSAEGGCADRRQLDRIEQQQQQLVNQLKHMVDQQAEHDALVAEVQQTILAEVGEIKQIVDSIQPGKPIDLSKLQALKDAVSGMSDAVKPAPPTGEGKKTVLFGFRSRGEETFSVIGNNGNVTEERAQLLGDVHDTALATAAAQESGGSAFDSDVFCTGGESASYTNAKQIAAYQLVWLDALRAQAQAQLEGA